MPTSPLPGSGALSSLRTAAARLSGVAGDRRGATAVEFAFILPVLLLTIMVVMETGRAVWHQNVLERSVQEAVRYVAAHPDATDAEIIARAEASATSMDTSDTTYTVTTTAGPSADIKFVEVSASHPYAFLLPAIGDLIPNGITLTSDARVPVLE
jgi:Flp pilus assembly protein TadG